MKPICIPCQRFFRPKKNGFCFTEGMPTENAKPGTAEPDKWKPYKIWAGDKWECQGCFAEILVGFGASPIAIQHEENFEADREALHANQFQVNDC